MKKTIFTLAIIGAALLGFSFAKAAPGPWGIALNMETKECAGFWPGDEFVAYHLPNGWKSYIPKYDPETKKTSLVTDIGECDFKIREEEKCCQQLGYKFVSENIGQGQKTILRDREAFEDQLKNQPDAPKSATMPYPALILIGLAIAAIVIAIIFFRRRRKTKIE
jgi:LPXTG-motif cell wall-anchored protein